MADYDVIVVGAGVAGCATAYQSAKNGKKTLLIEQFLLPHTRGSSHGPTRVIRRAYTQQIYAELMKFSYQKWFELERETGRKLYENIPMLSFGATASPALNSVEEALKLCGCRYETLSQPQLKARYPTLKLDADKRGVLDHSAGVLRADQCLLAYQEMFKQNGGVIRDGQEVIDIAPGDVIKVSTKKESFTAKAIVLTCGPWTNKVLAKIGGKPLKLPLKPNTVNVVYFREKSRDAMSHEKGFPIWADYRDGLRAHYWGLPCFEYPDMAKMGYEVGTPTDPDQRDKNVKNLWVLDKLSEYVKGHFNGVNATPSIVETCMYTITPDTNYVLDRHPAHQNIVIGAGLSGHGFKMAPVIGEMLSSLATRGASPYDTGAMFSISRFGPTAKY